MPGEFFSWEYYPCFLFPSSAGCLLHPLFGGIVLSIVADFYAKRDFAAEEKKAQRNFMGTFLFLLDSFLYGNKEFAFLSGCFLLKSVRYFSHLYQKEKEPEAVVHIFPNGGF